jgi:hypothetical protein
MRVNKKFHYIRAARCKNFSFDTTPQIYYFIQPDMGKCGIRITECGMTLVYRDR